MTQAEYVAYSGLSKGQVSKLVAKGMPLTSKEAADEWRGSGAKKRPPESDPAPPADSGPYRPPEAAAPADPLSVQADGPQGAYERQRYLEKAAWAQAVTAIKQRARDIQPLIAGHGKAASNLVTLRHEVLDLMERERRLVSGDWVRQQMTRHDGAVAVLLRAMPKQLAARIAPHDPAHAEQELERWVEEVALKTLHSTSPWPSETTTEPSKSPASKSKSSRVKTPRSKPSNRTPATTANTPKTNSATSAKASAETASTGTSSSPATT